MPTYIYKAKKGPTDIIEGQVEADSQDHAIDQLSQKGLLTVSIRNSCHSRESGNPEKWIPAFAGMTVGKAGMTGIHTWARIRSQDIDVFTRQLASLVRAEVPILRALSLISRQTENNALREVAGSLEKQIRDGKTFSGAIAEHPMVFNALYLNMVRAGEKSGALGEVLLGLAEYRQKEHDIRQKIVAALAYPLLMIAVGIATIFIMLTFFLPKFIVLFEDMKQTLPLATRILIGISKFMAANWYWFLLAAIFIFLVIGRTKQGSKKKFFLDFIKLRLPFVKIFIKNTEVARFTRTLSLLIKSGIPVCDGLGFATEVLDNDSLKSSLRKARLDIINQGSSLSTSLKNSDVFPAFALNMIAVGEESGKLEWSLKDISDVYDREVEQGIKIATTLLEPVLILFVGAFVGFIVFAMLLPVFNMSFAVR